MKRGVLVLALGCVLSICGCASQGWQSADVPLPRSTPFDSNEFARNAYLEGYRAGYRAQRSGDRGVSLVDGPYQAAQMQGFRAGASQALSEMSGEVPPVTPMESGR